jgi:hypothetical protein
MTVKKKGFLRKISGFDDIYSNLLFTKSLIKKSSNVDKKDLIAETFEDAIERFNINNEDVDVFLSNKYNNLRSTAYICYLFSFIIFILSIYNTFFSSFSIFVIINYLLLVYFFLMGFSNAFRCYQIKNKKLGMLKEFSLKIKHWFPSK